MIYPDNFEAKIEFHKIRELLKGKCICELGKQKAGEMRFQNDYHAIRKQLEETDEFKTILLLEEGFPTKYFPDEKQFLSRAVIEGAYLEPENFFNLLMTLQATVNVLHFFKTRTEGKYTRLSGLCMGVKPDKFVIDNIDAVIDKNAQVKDNASKELSAIRSALVEKQKNVSRRLHAIMKQMQGEGWVSSDLSITLVNGRTAIPVDSTHKRKIKGLVHAESATGKTSYIEPSEVVGLNNEIKELEFEEQKEIVRILVSLTNIVRTYLDDILNCYGFLSVIDFIRAKAVYAISIEAVLPAFNDEQIINLHGARHPLLYAALKKEGRGVVPLDIQINRKQRVILISGPNAGGKSVCLKTIGLLQYMLQCGLLIPVSGSSETGMFDNIFIDIGDEQSIENDLSTYSSHLGNMKFFLKNSNPGTLLLIDEFGSGTEPAMGGAIAEAVLEELNLKKIMGVITTHYSGLKHFAMSAEGIINGAMLFDTEKLEPLFILETGKPGSSFAFEIARKKGIPGHVVQNAMEKVGKDHIYFDKHLRDVLRDKKYIEMKRDKIHQSEKRIEAMLEQLSSDLAAIDKDRKEILKKAKADAVEMLASVNKKIENTILEIKKAQAEKEQTKLIRGDIAEYRENLASQADRDDEKIARKINQLNERAKRIRQKKNEPVVKNTEIPVVLNVEIKTGDFIKLKHKDVTGEVIDMNEKNFVVALGNFITTIDKSEAVRVEVAQVKPKVSRNSGIVERMRLKSLSFSPSIDLRGMRGDEALVRLAEYMDEAVMLNITEVRILHGKGHGILRQLIRDYLKTIDAVRGFSDEQVQFGGDGITVVKLG